MKLAGTTVCVTGAAGFLGQHLLQKLLERGAKVIALDNFAVGRRDALKGLDGDITVCQADIRDLESIREPLAESEVVYHLAAIANPRTCQNDFPLAFDVNVRGTANVLEACKHVKRFVFLSSIMVYGEPRYLPIDERHPLDGRDPYAASKIICEELVKISNYIHQIPFTIVRNSNTYGPNQGEDYLAPTLIRQGLETGVIEIWDPRTIRDFLFIDDTVEALTVIVETETTAVEIINLGSGLGASAGQLADLISEKLGVSWEDANKPAPISSKLIADTAKLKALTGWQQRVSLEEGVDRAIESFRLMGSRRSP